MSSLRTACHCEGRDKNHVTPFMAKNWVVVFRHRLKTMGEHSAWSVLYCRKCASRWKTKAHYVLYLKGDEEGGLL